MGRTLWRKIRRDLSRNKGRSLLVVTAIAVGVAATGSILISRSITDREMARSFAETNPPSAILHIASVDDDVVAAVESRAEVAAAEARREIAARLVREADEWVTLRLVVVDDFDDLTVGRFFTDSGDWNPGADEVVIERASLDEVPMAIGDVLAIEAPGGADANLTVIGLAHDPGRMPAWMTGVLVGYVTPDGLDTLGIAPTFDELQVVFAGDGDRAANRRAADALADDLRAAGVDVGRVEVPTPGLHPAADVTQTLGYLLQAFGVLALITSAALVTILVAALLEKQSLEIGLMKTAGAGTGQIAAIYVGMVLLLSTAGLIIGFPLAMLGARGLVGFSFNLLNLDVASYQFAAWVVPVLVLAAVGVPLLAVAYPVVVNSRRPVRQVLTDHGVTARGGGDLLQRLRGWGRAGTLGIRNAFRARSRTALTVLAISLGGAAFMVAINTGVAWSRAVDAEFAARSYDLEVRLDQAYDVDLLEGALAGVPQVQAAEAWNEYAATMEVGEGGTGDAFRLLVPPASTSMVDYPLLEGRWLLPGDENAVVVTQNLDDPAPTVGSTAAIKVNDTFRTWTVVGKVRQLSSGQAGAAYAGDSLVVGNTANQLRIAGHGSYSLLGAVDTALGKAEVGVAGMSTAADGREALDDHLYIIAGMLLFMALLLSVVGGLGLAQTMSINVLERRREIGVMRAVGASTGAVIRVVVSEGVFVGILSWLAAAVISVPATLLVETATGNIFLKAPLVTSFSLLGVGIWLAIVVAVAAVASALPALEMTEIPAGRALAYE